MHINEHDLKLIEDVLWDAKNDEFNQERWDAATDAIVAARNATATDEQLDLAGQAWRNIEGIQIDDDAGTSQTDEGFWVQGWLWVGGDDAE